MQIDIQGLRAGLNSFEFEPDLESLLPLRDNLRLVKAQVISSVDKSEHSVVVDNTFKVRLDLNCDNCLKSFVDDLEDKYTLFYSSDWETVEHDDEEILRFLSPKTRHLDLAEGLRENLLLTLPMRIVCDEDCLGLCPNCGVDLNKHSCKCETGGTGSRWDGLKKLLDKSQGTA